jgi:type II secretion system protein H
MLILESDKKRVLPCPPNSSDGGFTLIEILLALMIVAILLSVAVLAIPNHDERYWRNNLDQLVSTLNAAQDESQSSGIPVSVAINKLGWRFSKSTRTGQAQDLAQTNTFIPEVYLPHAWFKPVNVEPIQLNLGAEYVNEELRIPLEQEKRSAILIRSTDGHFYWKSQ